MAQVIITINHREYPILCEDGGELQVMKLARILDEKANTLISALGQINENLLLAMVGLIVADELSEAKKELSTSKTDEQPHSAEDQQQIEQLKASLKVAQQKIIELEETAAKQKTELQSEFSKKDIEVIDNSLSLQINSLAETIKSVALKLKSV